MMRTMKFVRFVVAGVLALVAMAWMGRDLHLLDASTLELRNLGLAVDRFFGLRWQGDRLAFAVSEADQGGADLNGDGVSSGSLPTVPGRAAADL